MILENVYLYINKHRYYVYTRKILHWIWPSMNNRTVGVFKHAYAKMKGQLFNNFLKRHIIQLLDKEIITGTVMYKYFSVRFRQNV